MGELQYGVYDDECEGLTPDEIDVFYDLNDDQEVQGSDEDSDESDDGDDYHEESEADMEIDEPESDDSPIPDLLFDMEVHSSFIKFLT